MAIQWHSSKASVVLGGFLLLSAGSYLAAFPLEPAHPQGETLTEDCPAEECRQGQSLSLPAPHSPQSLLAVSMKRPELCLLSSLPCLREAKLHGEGGESGGSNSLTFRPSNINIPQALRQTVFHLLEPTVTISNSGVMYVTAHAPAPDTRSPVFIANSDGEHWSYLAHADEPAGAEGTLTVDSAGHAWLFDNGVQVMPLYRWCVDATQPCGLIADAWGSPAGPCGITVLPDSPRVAWGSGSLLLANYQGYAPDIEAHGYVQIGVLPDSLGAPVWNLCTLGPGGPSGWPSSRSDGTFVIPQHQPPTNPTKLVIAKGNDARAMAVQDVFSITTAYMADHLLCAPNYGWSGFTQSGRLYLGAAFNFTSINIGTSTDLVNFQTLTYDVPGNLVGMWLSANKTGEGALLTFALGTQCGAPADFYAAHVRYTNGNIIVNNSSFIARVTKLCRDYNGSAVGPDGRAYQVVFDAGNNGCNGIPVPDNPLTVYIQNGGPTL